MAKRRARLLENVPPRTWVALSEDETRIVATGSSFSEAAEKAKASGENDPVLTLIPDSWAPVVLTKS
jgi:hypothetical protein